MTREFSYIGRVGEIQHNQPVISVRYVANIIYNIHGHGKSKCVLANENRSSRIVDVIDANSIKGRGVGASAENRNSQGTAGVGKKSDGANLRWVAGIKDFKSIRSGDVDVRVLDVHIRGRALEAKRPEELAAGRDGDVEDTQLCVREIGAIAFELYSDCTS